MHEGRRSWDRRSETRTSAAGRVSWEQIHGGENGWGLLSDASGSSVSFITSNRSQPELGAEIDLVGASRPRRRYRVTRVWPFDESLSVIACRSTSWASRTPAGQRLAWEPRE